MLFRRFSAWLLPLCGFVFTAPANAACVVSTVGVSFGTYDTQSAAPGDAVGALTINCPTGRPDLFATVSSGTGSSGNFNAREMVSPGSMLQYNLFTDSTRTQIWGDGSSGSVTVTVPVVSRWGSQNIYGRIPAGQLVTAGTYSDTVVVTVEY